MTTSRPLRDSSPNAQVFFPGAATQTKGITPGSRVAAQIGAASSQQRSQCSRDWTQAQGRFGDPNRVSLNTPAICPSEVQTFMVGSSDSTCRFTISTQYGIDKYEFSTSCASEHLSWQNSFAPRKLGQNYIRPLGPAGSSWVPDGALEHTLSDHRSCYSYPKGTREKDCRGGESYAGKRGHLPSRPTPSSLFLQNLSSAKEGRKVQASNEPASSEQTYTVPPFQNGRYPCSSGSFADRRLDVPYRSQGRLFQHTYTPEPQKVPQVSMAASSLRVCLPTLWPFISTSCVHKDPQTSDGILQVPRGAGGDISRRSANNAPRQRRGSTTPLPGIDHSGSSGVSGELSEVPVDSGSDSSISGVFSELTDQGVESPLRENSPDQISSLTDHQEDKVSARRLAQVLGIMSAAVLAIQPAPLHYRDLQALKHKALQMRGYDAEVTLSERARNDLVWWANNLDSWNGRKMREDPPVIQMETDASRSGWGGFCQGETTGGCWDPQEKAFHINALEMLAVLYALKAFTKGVWNKTVLILSDNQSVVSHINKMGGTRSPDLIKLTKLVWSWGLANKLSLIARHIPGKVNITADFLSRFLRDRTDWVLNREVFRALNKLWGPFQVDLFATRFSAQVPRFFSWRADPEAEATDAFTQNWSAIQGYAHPPWCLITRTLQKVRREQTTLTIITPLWKTQPWFPVIMEMVVDHPILLPDWEDVVTPSPNCGCPVQDYIPKLVTWRVSGDISKVREFQTELETLSLPPGDPKPMQTTTLLGENGRNGVKHIMFRPFQHTFRTS